MSGTRTPATYADVVRTFDHARLATLPAYAALRQALSDLANEIAGQGGMKLPGFLAAVQDMAATAPYGDMCTRCSKECDQAHHHDAEGDPLSCGAYALCWPHAVERDGGWITGTYRCRRGHTWTCGYAINIVLDF